MSDTKFYSWSQMILYMFNQMKIATNEELKEGVETNASNISDNALDIEAINSRLDSYSLGSTSRIEIKPEDWILDNGVYYYALHISRPLNIYFVSSDTQCDNVLDNKTKIANNQISIGQSNSNIIFETLIEPINTLYFEITELTISI